MKLISVLKSRPCIWLAFLLLPSFRLLSGVEDKQVLRDTLAPEPITVRFCAPKNNVYPFFITEDDKLTGINPDMMRQVFNELALPEARLEYVRRPWKRCNVDLDVGDVDMMIGGYDSAKRPVIYPFALGFTTENSVVSVAEVCFFSMPGKQMQRTRDGMGGNGSFIVGIEAGFSKRHNRKMSISWLELYNPIEKYKMLEIGRVDAIIQICGMDGIPIQTVAERMGFMEFEMLYPPYLTNPAYVVFSEKFADSHTELAKRIIKLSTQIDKDKVYQRYRSLN